MYIDDYLKIIGTCNDVLKAASASRVSGTSEHGERELQRIRDLMHSAATGLYFEFNPKE